VALHFARSVWNIVILSYIDDFIICASSLREARLHRDLFLVLISLLGFQIREEKSSLIPSHEVKYLGFLWNSETMKVSLPSAKVKKLVDQVGIILDDGGLTVKDLQRLMGRLESVRFVFQDAPLFYRALQRKLNIFRKKERKFLSLDHSLSMKRELLWWFSEFPKNHTSRSLLERPVSVTITSDAAGTSDIYDSTAKSKEYAQSSYRGYGAFDDRGNYIQKEWIDHERDWHINIQETVGAIVALKSMALPGDHVLLRLDNMTVLAYLRKRGGTRNYQLCKLGVDTGLWLMKNNIVVSFEHVSSCDNDIADMLSRFSLDFWEFFVCRDVFDYIVDFFKAKYGVTPTCDVFASDRTKRMETYVSWKQDPLALGRDAFLLQDWTPLPYLFPPTPLLARVLREVELRKTKAILIAPYWSKKSWFPHLQAMKIAELPLPPARECLVHNVYQTVEAYLDPLTAFLLDGNLPDH